MLKSPAILLSVAILLILSQACGAPGVSPPDTNAMNTAIAQTIVSGLTQTAGAVIPIDIENSPLPTFTPELRTFTPTATLSPTPEFTPTPLIPQISVSVATNCRVGPGKVYDRVGALLVGEVAEVVGRNPTGNYWYILNPRQANGFCWLWGEYATLSGNTGALPVYTPPPTPTPSPDFEVWYLGQETCTGSWWVDIEMENLGGVTFRSISLTVRDTVTDVVVSTYADRFVDNSGCLASVIRDDLAPGAARVVSSPPFAYDFTGHRLRATITLCSNLGQSGTCATQVIHFTP